MSLSLEAARANDDPRGEIQAGLIVLGCFAGLFMLWGAAAPLDAAITAAGQVSVFGHDQVVQATDSGVVAAVDVADGQKVKTGQVLVQMAPEALAANVNSMRVQLVSLRAQEARLEAEMTGASRIVWPASLLNATGDDAPLAKAAMKDQQHQFDTGAALLRGEQALDHTKARGLQQEIGGLQGQIQSNERQQALLSQQLTGVKSLADRGFASQATVRNLERSEADLTGAHSQYAAAIEDQRQQIVASALDAQRVGHERSAAAAIQLKDTRDQLNALAPKLQAAEVELARYTLRAQTDGTVSGMTVFRSGSVVSPGQRLMVIVPSRGGLLVDARVAAGDAQGVHPGQKGELRLISPGGGQATTISGTVTQVSADSLTDDRTGQSFYAVKVAASQTELSRLSNDPLASGALRPGAPVQVMIPLRKRSAFEYLFEPISQSLWQAFRQR